MIKKRYVWIEDKQGNHIEDKLTKKRISQKKKKMVNFLNDIWEEKEKYRKENEYLKEEVERLERNKKELDMICKSYKDYYGEDVNKACWYGYIKRCYENNYPTYKLEKR